MKCLRYEKLIKVMNETFTIMVRPNNTIIDYKTVVAKKPLIVLINKFNLLLLVYQIGLNAYILLFI